MTADNSKVPIIDKLGIKADSEIAILHEPDHYFQSLGDLPKGVVAISRIHDEHAGKLDFIQAFYRYRNVLNDELETLMAAIKEEGKIWISWPKQEADVETDIAEDAIRELALRLGLVVDGEVESVNEVWSALKLRIATGNRRGFG